MKHIEDPKTQRAKDMREAEMRAPGALYHKGTDDDTDVGYAIDLRRADHGWNRVWSTAVMCSAPSAEASE